MVPNARHRCNSHSVPDDSGGGRGLMGGRRRRKSGEGRYGSLASSGGAAKVHT